jgi:ribose/xylose/arabinose/galactoside ABC-type transport system permease subunit
MRALSRQLARSQETGLVAVLAAVTILLTLLAGSHLDHASGTSINNFWNSHTLVQTATDASFFAIMAIGATVVIIAGGIDLSVGSIYALSGVGMALVLRAAGPTPTAATLGIGVIAALGIGLACGLLNGALVVGLRVHPFIVTLGTMWILRGIAFVATKAESILVPSSLTAITKASLGLRGGLFPMPMLAMLVSTIIGAIYLTRTIMGRHVFAFGGNPEASRYAGLSSARIQIGVFALTHRAMSCMSSPPQSSAARA